MAVAHRELDAGHKMVQTSLSDFVIKHIPDASLEGIDDIVLFYMLGVLEDLGSDDGFEIESFIEMMEAYIPGFGTVGSDEICGWIFKLAGNLAHLKERESTLPGLLSPKSNCTRDPPPLGLPSSRESRSAPDGANSSHQSENNEHSSKTNGNATDNADDDDDDETHLRQLLEMFPASCSLEARRCLATANGQMEEAVQLMLLRLESRDEESSVTREEWNSQKVKRDDKKVRDSILQRYSYVDVRDDSISHKPIMPKQEKKKMVRYLNGQVCTTKGERFIEIKKPVTEEMKRTYINLKPARSYHFH